MPAATKIGDNTTGVCNIGADCCPHSRTGTNSTGSPNVFINDKNAHRLGDSGAISCPHGGSFVSTSGSATVFVNNIPLTRVGDYTTCSACSQSGSHSTGSNNVFAG